MALNEKMVAKDGWVVVAGGSCKGCDEAGGCRDGKDVIFYYRDDGHVESEVVHLCDEGWYKPISWPLILVMSEDGRNDDAE